MKNQKYIVPTLEILVLNAQDIVTASPIITDAPVVTQKPSIELPRDEF